MSTYTVKVPGSDGIYDDLHEWVLSLLPPAQQHALTAWSTKQSYGMLVSDSSRPEPPPALRLRYDGTREHVIEVAGHKIRVAVSETGVSPDEDGRRRKPPEIIFTARSIAGRQALLDEIEDVMRRSHAAKRRPQFRMLDKWGSWEILDDLPARDLDSVVLPPGQMDRLTDDVARFLASEHDYLRRCIPWHRGHLYEGPPGPQPLSAKVLTPRGWTTMGTLKVGDEVTGTDGKGHKVLAVYDFGERPVYEITFSDGAVTRADAAHRWAVQTKKMRRSGYLPATTGNHGTGNREYRFSKGERWLIKTTTELSGGGRGSSPDSIPVPSPVELEKRELLLHPYVLGALLGDGSFSHMPAAGRIQFTTGSAQFAELVGAHAEIRPSRSIHWTVRAAEEITSMGLRGLHSHEKFIPAAYLCGSVDQRHDLLQGLMDSDGRVRIPGKQRARSITWATTSERMRDQFIYLVRSLGGTACLMSTDTRREYPCWTVRIELPESVAPFRRDDKAVAAREAPSSPSRHVRSVAPAGSERVRCILVDADDHLYITDDFIVTSNTGKTSVARAIASHFGMDVWYLPLADVKKDGDLLRMATRISPRSMLLLEDIDVFHAATQRDDDSDLTLSGLLNTLDGIATPHGPLTVLTTNAPEVLDHAVVRAGRIDLTEHFSYADSEQVSRLIGRYYDTDAPDVAGGSMVAPAEVI